MEPITTRTIVIAVIFIVLNTAGFWVREWLKHKTWNKNGKDLTEIKGDIKVCADKLTCMDGKMNDTKVTIAEVKTAVNAQKEQCGKTVDRFDAAINNQYDHLIKLAKKK